MKSMVCRELIDGEYQYKQARKTAWRPGSGLNPRLREYRCCWYRSVLVGEDIGL